VQRACPPEFAWRGENRYAVIRRTPKWIGFGCGLFVALRHEGHSIKMLACDFTHEVIAASIGFFGANDTSRFKQSGAGTGSAER